MTSDAALDTTAPLGEAAHSQARTRQQYALLVKQMLHGLEREELATLTEPTNVLALPALKVQVSHCLDGASSAETREAITGPGGYKGVLHDQHGAQILVGGAGNQNFCTGVLRIPTPGKKDQSEDTVPVEDPAEDHDTPKKPEARSAASTHVSKEEKEAVADADAVQDDLPADDAPLFGVHWIGHDSDAQLEMRIEGSTWCPIALLSDQTGRVHATWERRRRATLQLPLDMDRKEVPVNLRVVGAGEADAAQHPCSLVVVMRRTPTRNGLFSYNLTVQRCGSNEHHASKLTRAQFDVHLPSSSVSSFEAMTGTDSGLFTDKPTLAVGRNAAATWNRAGQDLHFKVGYWPTFEDKVVEHVGAVPALPKLSDLVELVGNYDDHLNGLDWSRLGDFESEKRHRDQAQDLLDACREGLAVLSSDPHAWQSFSDAARAVMSDKPVRVNGDWVLPLKADRSWRPFQMLFFLSAAASSVDPQSPRRRQVSVIEFPTGGGKTESYLLLAAFTLLYARKPDQELSKGAMVLMRYPLKLLAAQQFERAATVVAKLNVIVGTARSASGVKVYNSASAVRIGLWAGSSLSPNQWKGVAREPEKSFPLFRCPLCHASLKHDKENNLLKCSGGDCYFAGKKDARMDMVDDAVYSNKPEFLVATLDKLAVTPWRTARVKSILNQSLQLVIQDELHMIDDELGSLEGLYQIMLDRMVSPTSPKIVAASATTRYTERQVDRLYGRHEVLHVPAPEVRDGDWFVARTGAESRTTVVGILPSPHLPKRKALSRLLAAQMQAAETLCFLALSARQDGRLTQVELQEVIEEIDPYWTNLIFFGSRPALRESSLVWEQEVGGRASSLRWSNNYPGAVRHAYPSQRLEASSESSSTISEIIEGLSKPISTNVDGSARESRGVASACFATSMVEVGVDVPRLGLMTFIGLPKETASYIQAGGRVGRAKPALTYVFYRGENRRDFSIFENMQAYNERRNEKIEPALLAPFARGAVRRALPSLAAIELYYSQGGYALESQSTVQAALDGTVSTVTQRAGWSSTPRWLEQYADDLLQRLPRARAEGTRKLVEDSDLGGVSGSGLLLSLESEVGGKPWKWYAPTSLRTVAGEVTSAVVRTTSSTSAPSTGSLFTPNNEEDEA